MPFALAAVVFGLIAVGLLVAGLLVGRPPADRLWVVAGWLVVAGWVETAIQGFLYKIGTFLTWLHRYAPVAGRRPVPRLEDLYSRPLALLGWASWSAGVGLGGVAAGLGERTVMLAAAVLLGAGGLAFAINAARVGSH